MSGLLDKWRKPKPEIDRQQSLAAIPVRNQAIAEEKTETEADGLVIVTRIERSNRWWSRFAPPVIEQRIELDEMGAFVFQRIDGERTVRQIMKDFVKHFRVNRREAELATAEFIRKLAQKRLISLVIK